MESKLEEDDVVLCTVRRIEGTTVFLDIEFNGKNIAGTMIFSEVSPGRIRNIRDFISINKKIVCKVLRLKDNHPELSLRRVTARERDEVLEQYKKARMLESMLKPVFLEKTSNVLDKIKSKTDAASFLEEAREDPSLLKEIASGKELEQLQKIFSEKKESEKEVRKTIIARSDAADGLERLRSLLSTKDAEVAYQGSSRFFVTTRGKDFKIANQKIEAFLTTLKEKAKKSGVQFEIKEK